MYVSFVLACGVRLHLKMPGSRSAPLSDCMLILARRHVFMPSSEPARISLKRRRFSCRGGSLHRVTMRLHTAER